MVGNACTCGWTCIDGSIVDGDATSIYILKKALYEIKHTYMSYKNDIFNVTGNQNRMTTASADGTPSRHGIHDDRHRLTPAIMSPMLHQLLTEPTLSPRATPTNTVNNNVSELTTGTARDSFVRATTQ